MVAALYVCFDPCIFDLVQIFALFSTLASFFNACMVSFPSVVEMTSCVLKY